MSHKTDEDKEFLAFLWAMMRGEEGYIIAAWFWAAGAWLAGQGKAM